MYRNLSRGSRVLQQHRHRLVQQQQQRFNSYEQSTDTATTLMKCIGAMAVGGAVLVTVQPKGASSQASEQLPVARGDNELGNADIRSKIEADLEAQKKPTEEEVVVVEEPVEIVVEEVEEPVAVEEAAPVEEVVEVEAPVEEPEPVVVEEVAEVAVETIEAVAEVVEELAEEVAEAAEAVAEAIEAEVEAAEAVAEAVEAAIEEVGLVAVEVVEEVEAVVETVVEEVAEVEAAVEAAVEAVVEEVAAVEATVDEVVEAAVEEVAAVEAAVETVVEEVVEVADAVEVVAEEVAATVEAVVEETVEVAETIADVVAEVVEVVAEAKDEVVEVVEEVVETVEVAVEAAVEEVAVVVEEIAQVEAAVEAAVDAVVEEVAVVEAAVETVVDEAVELAQAVEAAVAEVVAVADEVLEVVAEPAAVAPVDEATSIDAEITSVQDGVNQIAAEVEAAAVTEAESVNAIGGVGVVAVAEAEALVEAAPVVAEEILPEQVAQVVVVEEEEVVTIVDSVIESEPVVAVEDVPVLAEVAAIVEEVAPVEEVAVVEEPVVEAVAEEAVIAEVAPVEEAAPAVADEAVIPVEAPVEEVVEAEEVVAEAVAYPEIPPEMPYVIIGGGTAAYAAVRAIRKYEPSAKILILSKEVQAPYNRTPLSKEMWFTTPDKSSQAKYENWKGKEVSLYHEKEDFYCTTRELQAREDYGGTALLLNATVDKLDANEKKVILTNGAEIKFDKALIAVGGQPRSLPVFDEAGEGVNSKVTKFRTVADFWKLERLSREKPGDIVVVGSGFLGTELAYALGERAKSINGLKVTQVCRESGVLGAVLPLHLSNYASAELEKNNVTVVRDAQIAKVALAEDDKMRLELVDGRHIDADHAVLAVGVDVDNALAQRSGLEHDPARGGFIVNSELESRRDIFVAGDAANFYDIRLGRRRVEHYDHAIVTGRLAGENMTGKRKAYSHQSMFWSDIGPDIGFEAIGLVDSRLKSVSVFTDQSTGGDVLNDSALSDKKYDRGVVFYTRNDTVVGVVTWNIFNKMGIARRLIAMEQHQPDYAELAKLFDVNKL